MIINFLMRKWEQNELALEQEPISSLFQRRKEALTELILLDLEHNGVLKTKTKHMLM